ncbi:MAG: beta-ketoacyl-[acyl-carrier-protein] synthase family protein [Puniceicoccales bacterium]|nr:beta-ketoacyl-[acyl-carrier-protein] synthase family protein [Puniceicoccales bacterium]
MIFFNAIGQVSALGENTAALRGNLRSGLVPPWEMDDTFLVDHRAVPVGAIKAPLPAIPPRHREHGSRNNRLALAALEQIREEVEDAIRRFGAKRIGVIMGTSTSGISDGESALAHFQRHGEWPEIFFYRQQEFGDTSDFLSKFLGVEGVSYTISTACSSSARAIISAARLIRAGVIDAAITGGADSLCRMTLNGFNSLEALSMTGCAPFSKNRDGITIGESAVLFLLSKSPASVALRGIGESSDGYHMSAPHPDGIGAEKAIRQALREANVEPSGIGYLNLHGTGTPLNDKMESKAVSRVFGSETPCSSTKHLTGHTLGACGALELAICCALLDDASLSLPSQVFTRENPLDETLAPIGLVTKPNQKLETGLALSNSFAFGGNNVSLCVGRA